MGDSLSLLSIAAKMGLLDEGTASAQLGGRPAGTRSLTAAGLLSESDAPALLREYHRGLVALMRKGVVGAATCGRCGATLEVGSDRLACAACGLRLTVKTTARAVSGKMPPEAAPAAARPENVFGKYVRFRKIGAGGFGSVWLAWDTQLSRLVAMKFLHAHAEDQIERFLREARTAANLSHPGIVPVYDVGRENNEHFIVMEYVRGKTAAELSPTVREAADVVRQVALALHHAHSRGVIHRDLKPQNIMVIGRKAVVMDFGLAKAYATDGSLSATGDIMGTPMFMSPEQARGDVRAIDARSDVWSLGATLYCLTTGRPPFVAPHGEVYEVLRKVIEEEPLRPSQLNAKIGRDFETIALKCLEKDPSRRYAGAKALAEDLERALAGEPIEAAPPSRWYRLRRVLSKRRAVVSVAAAGLLAVVGLAIWLVPRLRGAEAQVEQLGQQVESERDQALRFMRESAATNLEAILEVRRAGRPVDSQNAFAARLHDACEAAIARAPDDPEPHYQLGVLARALQRTGEALKHQEAALAMNPAYAPSLYERAILLSGEYDTARRDAEAEWAAQRRTDRPGPDRAAPDEALAAIRPELVELRSRIEADLRSSTEDRPGYRESARAHLAWARGRWEEALVAAREAKAADAKLTEAWHVEGRTLVSMRRFEEAAAAFTEAIRHDPGFLPFYFGRAYALRKLGRWEEVEADYGRVLELDPDNGLAYQYRGHDHMQFSRWEAAVADAEHAVRLMPHSIQARGELMTALGNRGLARADLGDRQGASADLGRSSDLAEEILRIHPDSTAAVRHRAFLRRTDAWRAGKEGRIDVFDDLWATTLKHCDRVVDASRNAAWAYNFRAESRSLYANQCVALGHDEAADAAMRSALEDYDRSLAIDSANAEAHCDRAWVLMNLGGRRNRPGDSGEANRLYDEATSAWREALRLDPELASAHLGLATLSLGRAQDSDEADEAREFIRTALEGAERTLALIPDDVAAIRLIGECHAHLYTLLARQGRLADALKEGNLAIAAYERAAAAGPGIGLSYYMLAGMRRRQADLLNAVGDAPSAWAVWAAAIEAYDHAERLDATIRSVHYMRGEARYWACRLKTTSGAAADTEPIWSPMFEDLEKATSLDPEDGAAAGVLASARAYEGLVRVMQGTAAGPETLDAAIAGLDRVLERWPATAQATSSRADILFYKGYLAAGAGRWDEAKDSWKRFLDGVSDYLQAAGDPMTAAALSNNSAWLLATCPFEELRNGALAMERAERAGRFLSENPALLDTLAAAHAETGDFEKAVDVQRKALALLSESAPDRTLYESRLRLYEAGRPYREPTMETGSPE